MRLEYLAKSGHLQIKNNAGSRHVLNDFIEDAEFGDTAKSDVTGEALLVKEIFNAVIAIPETRATTRYKQLIFDTRKGVWLDGSRVSLLDDFTTAAPEVRVFIDTIKAHGDGLFVELFELEKLKDEPVTELLPVIVNKSRAEDGIWIEEFVEEMQKVPVVDILDVVDIEGEPVFELPLERRIRRVHKVPRIRKVTDEQIARRDELRIQAGRI